MSNGLQIIGSNTGASVSIKVVGNGNQWIHVNAEATCNEVELASKTVSIATPQLSVTTSDDRSQQSSNYTYHTATAQQLPGTVPSDYKWYNEVNGMPTSLITTGLQLTQWPIPPCSIKYYQLRVETSCGTSIYPGYAYNSYGCGSLIGFTAYPNPANNEINILVQAPKKTHIKKTIDMDFSKTKREGEGFTVTLYNGLNKVVRKAKSKGSKITFDLHDLPVGIYYLHIYNAESINKSQISIER